MFIVKERPIIKAKKGKCTKELIVKMYTILLPKLWDQNNEIQLLEALY